MKLLIFPVILIAVSSYRCQLLKNPDKDFSGENLSSGYSAEQPKDCNHCLISLSVATKNIKEESYAPFTQGLKNFNYDFEVLGRQSDWKGWITRAQVLKKKLEEIKNSGFKGLILNSDTGDVLIQRGPAELAMIYEGLVEHLKASQLPFDYDNLIVVGAEEYCAGNCNPEVVSWFEKYGNNLNLSEAPKYRYPNGGFLLGPVEAMITYYTFTENYMKTVTNDDQHAMQGFTIKFPEKIFIDYKGRFVANVMSGWDDFNLSNLGLSRKGIKVAPVAHFAAIHTHQQGYDNTLEVLRKSVWKNIPKK